MKSNKKNFSKEFAKNKKSRKLEQMANRLIKIHKRNEVLKSKSIDQSVFKNFD